jgi:hypothetical protein
MTMAGTVTLKSFLSLDGGTTNHASQFVGGMPKSVRDAIEDSRLGDRAKYELPGAFDNTFAGKARFSSDLTFKKTLITAFTDGTELAFEYRKDVAAVGLNNLKATGNIRILECPPLGGDWNTGDEMDFTWRVNGPMTVTDGTTTWTLG